MPSATRVHPTAIIDPTAKLGVGVEIAPFVVIGPEVQLGDRCYVGPHSVVEYATVGEECRFLPHSFVGTEPQDLKYKGEKTRVEMGARTTVRECATIHRGTAAAGVTKVGSNCLIMAYVHIAHDCVIGNHTILANSVTLAGHVTIFDHAILGGFSLIHQFCKVGAHAFTGMGSKINCDVPPYVVVGSEMSVPRGINSEGLKRRGYNSEQISAIKRAYKTLYLSGLPLKEAREKLAEQAANSPEVGLLVEFIDRSERSILR